MHRFEARRAHEKKQSMRCMDCLGMKGLGFSGAVLVLPSAVGKSDLAIP